MSHFYLGCLVFRRVRCWRYWALVLSLVSCFSIVSLLYWAAYIELLIQAGELLTILNSIARLVSCFSIGCCTHELISYIAQLRYWALLPFLCSVLWAVSQLALLLRCCTHGHPTPANTVALRQDVSTEYICCNIAYLFTWIICPFYVLSGLKSSLILLLIF